MSFLTNTNSWGLDVAAFTGFVLANRRSMRQLISPELWELWDRLDLRIVVLLSLAFQITLVALGSRRKKDHRYWLRFVVWCAYLSADTIAFYALGLIQKEPNELDGHSIMGLRVFWMPFLLMHLGGPDTITAYALEDNELWLRQFFDMLGQTLATLYILFLSWDDSVLSLLYVVVLICGLIKYGERVWVLWSASFEQFRDSTSERQTNLMEAKGHDVVAHQAIKMQMHGVSDNDVGLNRQAEETELWHADLYERNKQEMLIAMELIDIYLPAFTDQPLGLDERGFGRSKLEGKNYLSVFNIIAIELGFVYDLLYTKAMLFQTRWGVASRFVTLSLTTFTLVYFTFRFLLELQNFYDGTNVTNLGITFVLVVAAIFLELYAILYHCLFSDEVICWHIKNNHSSILRIINGLQPLHKRRRWSNKISQFSLLSYSRKERHYLWGHKIQEIIQKYFYHRDLDVSNVLKDRLYEHITTRPANNMYKDIQSLWDEKWKKSRRNKELERLKWSIKFELDTCVLIWHVATEICYQDFPNNATSQDARVSLDLSQYMMHLMVMYPSMLPAGIGRFKFKDIHSMLIPFLIKDIQSSEEETTETETTETKTENLSDAEDDDSNQTLTLSIDDMYNLLLRHVDTQNNFERCSSGKNSLVRKVQYGSRLAKQLKEIEDDCFRFRLLRETWVGMLTLAALKCDANFHLQQLRRGGELLTHVWLLLVQFGYTDHFQNPDDDVVEKAEPVGQEAETVEESISPIEENDSLDEGFNST